MWSAIKNCVCFIKNYQIKWMNTTGVKQEDVKNLGYRGTSSTKAVQVGSWSRSSHMYTFMVSSKACIRQENPKVTRKFFGRIFQTFTGPETYNWRQNNCSEVPSKNSTHQGGIKSWNKFEIIGSSTGYSLTSINFILEWKITCYQIQQSGEADFFNTI